MTTTEKAAPTANHELTLTRIIDAPRAKVFRAWTDPELLKPGRFMHEALGFRDTWESRLLRTSSWSSAEE